MDAVVHLIMYMEIHMARHLLAGVKTSGAGPAGPAALPAPAMTQVHRDGSICAAAHMHQTNRFDTSGIHSFAQILTRGS